MEALGGSAPTSRKDVPLSQAARVKSIMPHAVHPKAKPPTKPKRPAHRPTRYTAELGEEIGALIAFGWSTKDAARRFGISPETVCRWAAKHAAFREAYPAVAEVLL
jgi:hypothetical protein